MVFRNDCFHLIELTEVILSTHKGGGLGGDYFGFGLLTIIKLVRFKRHEASIKFEFECEFYCKPLTHTGGSLAQSVERHTLDLRV